MVRRLVGMLVLLTFYSFVSAQSFGIRAGLNYTKFSGPLESGVNEKFSLANGFHFGVNYAYKFEDDYAIKAEVVYSQIGSKYNYDGSSFYKIPLGNTFIYEKGNSTIEMKVSNAYVSIPVTFQWQVSRKIEVQAGAYFSFLVGPRGNGTIYFEKNKDSLFFKQSLIHSYNKDEAGGLATSTQGAAVWVEGIPVTLARDAGAYYNYLFTEKDGNLYKSIDYGLTGGVNYFINRGFYIGLRYDFGLVDVTNNKMDYLRKSYDEVNNRGILSNHFDRNLGVQASFGFRF
ncbi:MAG: outer membrane beta-barrel protein [Saprospiraceae bacterium]